MGGKKELVEEQRQDVSLGKIREDSLNSDVGDLGRPKYHISRNILHRHRRNAKESADPGNYRDQIEVPSKYWPFILRGAHDSVLYLYAVVRTTLKSMVAIFFLPTVEKDVARYVKTYEACQRVGKPNQVIPKVLLQPITAVGEPFSELYWILWVLCLSPNSPAVK